MSDSSLDDRFRLTGLPTLGKEPSAEAQKKALNNLKRLKSELSELEWQVIREKAIAALSKAGIKAPAKMVDSACNEKLSGPRKTDEPRETPENLEKIAEPILNLPDQLDPLRQSLRRRGYAGATEAAELTWLALHSRSLNRPINLAVRGPSAAGKTHTVETVADYHPESAVHSLTAMSERGLVYSDVDFRHAYVVISEASALHRDGIGATIIRSLAWGDGIRYETVQKVKGELQARIIEKPGPTGLITTTTRDLDPEVETRMISIWITDSPDQTRAVVRNLAIEAAGDVMREEDFSSWLAASEWLQTKGVVEVVVPFAEAIGNGVPTDDVRMRRDFTQIMAVVRVHAFVHQKQRDRDQRGRILATADDYRAAHRLLEKVMAVTLDSVSDAIRETVEAVEKLNADLDAHEKGISCQMLADHLDVSRSTASRRAKEAAKKDFFTNLENRKGYSARYIVGDPLPALRTVLPEPEEVPFWKYPPKTAQQCNTPPETLEDTGKTGVAGTDSEGEVLQQHREPCTTPCNTPKANEEKELLVGVAVCQENQGSSEAPSKVSSDTVDIFDGESA